MLLRVSLLLFLPLTTGCALFVTPDPGSPASEVAPLRHRITSLHESRHELRRATIRRALELEQLQERVDVLAAELSRVRAFRARLDAGAVMPDRWPLATGEIPVSELTLAEALGVGRVARDRGPEQIYLYRTERGLQIQVSFRPLSPERRALLLKVMQAWEVMDRARRSFMYARVRAGESRDFATSERAWQNAARHGRSHHVELIEGRHHVVDLSSFRGSPEWRGYAELEKQFDSRGAVSGTMQTFLPRRLPEEPVPLPAPAGWIEAPRKLARAPAPQPRNLEGARTLAGIYEQDVIQLMATAEEQHWTGMRLEAQRSHQEVDLDSERRELYEILYSMRPAAGRGTGTHGAVQLWELSLDDSLGMRALDDILEADRWLFHRGENGVTALELDRVPDDATRATALEFLECLASIGESQGCVELLARLRDEGFQARILGWTPRRAHRLTGR